MKKFVSIIVSVVLIYAPVLAQQKLMEQLAQSKADTARLRLLTELGGLYKARKHGQDMADLDSAKAFLLKALPLSRMVPDSSRFSRIHLLMNLGEIEVDRHSFPDCKRYFLQSIAEAHKKNETELEAEGWERLGYILSYPEKKSAVYFKNAIALYKKMRNTDKVILNQYYYALDKAYAGYVDSATATAVQVIDKYKHTQFANLEMMYYIASRSNRIYGNFDKALFYALGGVRRMEALKDTSRGGTLYGELADVYQGIGDLSNAVLYYKKTIAFREKKNRKQKFLFEIGRSVVKLLIQQKKAAEALKFINQLERRHHPDSEFEACLVAQIKAYCYAAMGDRKLAEKYFLLTMKGLGDDRSDFGKTAHFDLARFYIDQKEPQKAEFYLNSFKKTAEYDVLITKELELLRFKIDSLNGKFGSAIDHYQRFKTINDSVFGLSKTKLVQQLQVEFETEKKNKDIALYKNNILAQQGKLQQASTMRNFILAGVGVLILFLGLLYNSYRFKQRKNDALNKLVLEKDGLLIEKDGLLQEKQWLLKEIHHRVKNNLAIVMGLLNRQSAYIDNDVALAAIQNSQNRMRSIALIHQKLYQSENLDLISMREYVDDLITHLKESFDLGNRIIFERWVEELNLDVSQAVPLGLIINEAITNAIKYAYPANSAGIIHISIKKDTDGQNLLQIRDHGPGLSKDLENKKTDSMGMNLIKGLSKQLGGSLEILNNNGLTINIKFKTELFVATSAATI